MIERTLSNSLVGRTVWEVGCVPEWVPAHSSAWIISFPDAVIHPLQVFHVVVHCAGVLVWCLRHFINAIAFAVLAGQQGLAEFCERIVFSAPGSLICFIVWSRHSGFSTNFVFYFYFFAFIWFNDPAGRCCGEMIDTAWRLCSVYSREPVPESRMFRASLVIESFLVKKNYYYRNK